MSGLKGLSLISSTTASLGGAETFRAVNPANGEPLEPLYVTAGAKQIDEAVEAAHRAAPFFGEIPGERRGGFLRAVATRIEAIVDELVLRVGLETGLPEARVRGETARTAGQLRLFASIAEEGSWVDARIDPAVPDRKPLARPDICSMLRPLGPVAVFGASNFPLAFSVAGGDTASALAAGCPVVVKAHPNHPGVSEMIGQTVLAAAKEAGMPDGIFALLFDAGHGVGETLVRHPLIKAVGFTGSLAAGRHLLNLAAAREEPIPVYAEMGSTNPVFLLPSALAARGPQIAEGLLQSVTMGAGQFCTKPGLVFTDGNEDFRRRIIELAEQSPAGCLLHAGIARSFAESLQRMRSAPHVETLTGPASQPVAAAAGVYVLETTAASLIENPFLVTEMFGPATTLVRYRDRSELLAVARELPGQLTATIHGLESELLEAGELISILATRAGRLIFNQFPTGVEVGHAMIHGGPYPASTDARSTSVGATAIRRFARPVCFQNFPDAALPPELRAANPRRVRRLINGQPES